MEGASDGSSLINDHHSTHSKPGIKPNLFFGGTDLVLEGPIVSLKRGQILSILPDAQTGFQEADRE
jgi:hypothetical protein